MLPFPLHAACTALEGGFANSSISHLIAGDARKQEDKNVKKKVGDFILREQ